MVGVGALDALFDARDVVLERGGIVAARHHMVRRRREYDGVVDRLAPSLQIGAASRHAVHQLPERFAFALQLRQRLQPIDEVAA